FPAPLLSQVAGGTQYLWTGTGLTLFPGVTLSITLTGQLGPVCATTPVTNAAWIAGDDSVSTTVLITNTTGFAAQPAVLAVSASMTLSPPSPIPGGPVSYRLVVSNTGAATITDLEVVDTISAVLTAPGTDQPPGFGVPTVVQATPSGTRFIWTGSGLALAPGAAFTFTISGVAGTVAAFTTVSNTACVTARSACAVTGAATNGAWFGIGPVPTLAITAIKTQTPLAPLPGAAVTYRLDLTNI